ncbi:conserved hypothetical protein [Allorhizobium ampelinum S4]|uniref:Uncharacterized protein n=1 Tax=Allorhizobium ampelinum (strain ATCC BAA-846 / DSM 112012 / S4) TaxID=311402 RepID=B9JYL7_ALLAM|nr:conserved hypothetical protein [Allorhizobium ampelinum S4]
MPNPPCCRCFRLFLDDRHEHHAAHPHRHFALRTIGAVAEMRRHFQHENLVAVTLDEVIAKDLGGGDHQIAAFLDLHIEIIGAAFGIAVGAALAIAGQRAFVDDRIDNAIIVDIQPGDVVVIELSCLADLTEMILLVDFRVTDQLLLRQGDRGRQGQQQAQEQAKKQFHGMNLR